MTSISKKRKIKHNFIEKGGEKRALNRCKRFAMYHKQNRVANKKICKTESEDK